MCIGLSSFQRYAGASVICRLIFGRLMAFATVAYTIFCSAGLAARPMSLATRRFAPVFVFAKRHGGAPNHPGPF